MRLARAAGSLGLSVLWRPAHGSLPLKHWKVVLTQALPLRSASPASAPTAPLRFQRPRRLEARCRSDEEVPVARASCCAKSFSRTPHAFSSGKAPWSVQAQCSVMQAVCHLARGLTLPSRGPVPASRAWPLMSNVRPQVVDRTGTLKHAICRSLGGRSTDANCSPHCWCVSYGIYRRVARGSCLLL